VKRTSTAEDVILAYMMNGQPLTPVHGFPLRLIVPGFYGMASVKWLDSIELINKPFLGTQMKAYWYHKNPGDKGQPVTTINVRSLMLPPGIPDFFTRERFLEPGLITLEGRAWAGRNQISKVEISVNGGKDWELSKLEKPLSQYSWRKWSYPWNAKVGKYVVIARATDDKGNQQTLEQNWNEYGMGHSMVQKIQVTVVDSLGLGRKIPVDFETHPRF